MDQLFKCGHKRSTKNSVRGYCRFCHNKRSREYSRRIRRDSPQIAQDRTRVKRYGKKAVEHYQLRMKFQKGLCEICLIPMLKPQQDHSPLCCGRVLGKSGQKRSKSCGKCLRGLLCLQCNARLGIIEQGSWINKAQKYLSKWKGIHARQKISYNS